MATRRVEIEAKPDVRSRSNFRVEPTASGKAMKCSNSLCNEVTSNPVRLLDMWWCQGCAERIKRRASEIRLRGRDSEREPGADVRAALRNKDRKGNPR